MARNTNYSFCDYRIGDCSIYNWCCFYLRPFGIADGKYLKCDIIELINQSKIELVVSRVLLINTITFIQ